MHLRSPADDLARRWRDRRRRSGWLRVLTALGALALLVALVGLFAHYRAPRSIATIGLTAFSPYLVLGAAAGVVIFACTRGLTGWLGVGVGLATIACYVAIQLPLYVASAVPAHGTDVAVMTLNLKLGLADPDAVVAAVREHRVEVLMLQELTELEAAALVAAGLNGVLPHSLVRPSDSARGTGLWSRYPLTGADARDDFIFAFLTAQIMLPGSTTPTTVVALHMAGPYPQPWGWLRDIDHLPQVLRGLPSGAPVIVGGDFNATPDTTQFRRLLHGGYADAADQTGAGYLPTYPADRSFPPLLAIDHVLTRQAVAHRIETLTIARTDHRALVVTVRVPD